MLLRHRISARLRGFRDILQGIRLRLRADIDGSIEELAAWRGYMAFSAEIRPQRDGG